MDEIEEKLDRLVEEQQLGRINLPAGAFDFIEELHALVFEEGQQLTEEQERRVREIYRENLGDFE